MPEAPERFRVVLTTAGSSAVAERLARELVERRLAACVNVVGPVRSTYRWKGQVLTEEERLLIIKTDAEHLDGLRAALDELHPYEVPEMLALAVADGAPTYLDWLADCLRVRGGSPG